MAYLGNSPVLSQQEYRNIDNISGSFNGSTTSFALLVNGVAPVPAPQSSNQCLISVNGVVQKPDDTGATGFRLSGGNIVFSAAPTSGQSFFGVILAGADYIYAGQNFPDGTVSAPPITFNQDLDTGFYRSGSGEVKFTANGANTVTFSSNGLTAPSFIPTSSSAPTNGVYLSAANTVAISTNGTGRLFINSSGQTSIGTSSPDGRLTIQRPSNNQGIAAGISLKGQDGTTQGGLGTDGVNDNFVQLLGAQGIKFHTNNTDGTTNERLRITSDGKVGVGTTSPTYLCNVLAASGSQNIFQAGQTGVSNGYTITSNGTNLTHAWFNGGSEAARIDSSGRVGIGTSSPSNILQVTSSATAAVPSAGASGHFFAVGSSAYGITGGALTNGNSYFQVTRWDGTATNYDLLLQPNGGRVGIGTSSPAELLHVKASGNYGVIIADNNSTTGGGRFAAYQNGSLKGIFGVSGSIEGNTTSDAGLFAETGGAIRFYTNGSPTAKAILDSSGRLLVGTSSDRLNGNLLQVVSDNTNNVGVFAGRADLYGPRLDVCKSRGSTASPTVVSSGDQLANFTFRGHDGTNYIPGATIEAYVDGTPGANDMPGRLVFSTTADGSASPTERMRISNNGVVTIKNGAVAEIGTLTDAATITPDFASNCNFTVTLGGARTIANPTNVTAGQSGSIFIVQDGTGGRTASWGSNWDWAGGTAPTLSTGANAVDRVDYICRSATSIHAVWTGNYS